MTDVVVALSDQRVRRQDAEGPESVAPLFNVAVVTCEPWRT
jgi:hypothetical protein